MIKHFVDENGNYIGAFDGAEPPTGSTEVSEPPLHARDVWDGLVWVTPIEHIIETKKAAITEAMNARITQGIIWKYDSGSDEYTVGLDDRMHNWMVRQLAKLNESRVNPHNGFVQSNSEQFSIDDDGLRELCLFGGMWGDEISGIRIFEDALLHDLGYPQVPTGTEQADVEAYDVAGIDWTVTWPQADQDNGWSDRTVTQLP